MVKFWDSMTCTQLRSFDAHGADVLCLAIGPVRISHLLHKIPVGFLINIHKKKIRTVPPYSPPAWTKKSAYSRTSHSQTRTKQPPSLFALLPVGFKPPQNECTRTTSVRSPSGLRTSPSSLLPNAPPPLLHLFTPSIPASHQSSSPEAWMLLSSSLRAQPHQWSLQPVSSIHSQRAGSRLLKTRFIAGCLTRLACPPP